MVWNGKAACYSQLNRSWRSSIGVWPRTGWFAQESNLRF